MDYGLLRPHTRGGTARRAGLAAATALLAGIGFAAAALPAHAETLNQQTFAGDSVPAADWTVTSLGAGTDRPCLTAAASTQPGSLDACVQGAADAVGSGVFRITDNVGVKGGNGGALMLNQTIESGRGLSLEFDTYQWNAKPYNEKTLGPRGGDGISFYLVDGASPASVGEPGGALGYRNLKGAFVGIGFDEYGNFSNPTVFKPITGKDTGKPTGCNTGAPAPNGCVIPNSVVVRGAQSTDYAYITGKQLTKDEPIAVDAATDKAMAKRHVVVDITTKNLMTVSMRFTDDGPLVPVVENLDLDNLPGQPKLPKTIKVGWAASTGAATANHAIGGFIANTLNADLKLAITNDGPWNGGGTGSYTATVSSNPEYGYADDPLKLSVDIPEGVTPTAAAGDGWTCAVEGQKVTCDRDEDLAPGASAPPVKIDVAIAKPTSGAVTANGVVESVTEVPGGVEINPADNKASSETTVTPAALPPVLTTVPGGDTTIPAGGTGEVTLTTSNDPAAGPTTDTVTEIYTPGPGTEVTGASGDGWTCVVTEVVTCTRPGSGDDALKPGDSYPPIKIGLKVPADATPGDSTGTVTTSTPGNEAAAGDKGTPVPVKITAAPTPDGQLDVKITSKPNPYVPGKPYTYQVTVSNTGTTDVTGAKVVADWPQPWDTIKWTCKSDGGACPAASGVGDLNEVIDLAAGGSMTFTVTCKMPEGVDASYTATATVTAADTNCTEGCKATDENAPAAG